MYRCTKCGKELKLEEIAAHEEFHAVEEAKEAERQAAREKEERELGVLYTELSKRIEKFNDAYETNYELVLRKNNWDLPNLFYKHWI